MGSFWITALRTVAQALFASVLHVFTSGIKKRREEQKIREQTLAELRAEVARRNEEKIMRDKSIEERNAGLSLRERIERLRNIRDV